MKLLLRSDQQRAYGSTLKVSGVSFRVVAQLKQGFLDVPFWVYEVEVVSKE